MKIVLINNLYTPYAVGGAETVVERRAKEAVDRGEDVVIITTGPYNGFSSLKPQKGSDGDIIIYRFWVPNLCWYKDLSKHSWLFRLVWHFVDLYNIWSARIVKRILQDEQPDVVETHNLMGMGYELRIKNKELGIKWKHYLHDVQLVEPSGILPWNHKKDNIYQKIYSAIMKRKFIGVDEVISPTEFLKGFYKERGFFGSSEFLVQSSQGEISKSKLQIPNKFQNQNYKFLFVGSLVEHKGLRVLMQAWDLVCHSDTERSEVEESLGLTQIQRDPSPSLSAQDWELHIVGDGVLKKEIEVWVENKSLVKNIFVHGRLENEKLEKIYRQSDILIFPSVCIENNPTVIHEAVHYGLGVIASDTGGVREILPNDNFWLYRPDDVEGLARIMGERG